MGAAELPEGRYLSCTLRVTAESGGQTRALLLRNRILAEAGVRPDVLTLGAAPDLPERRQTLLDRGLLLESMELLNIYEHYEAHGWGPDTGDGGPLADLSAHRVAEDHRSDGSPWRVTYKPPGQRALYDYLRRDGTPYLRIPAFGLAGGSPGRGTIQRVAPDGRVVGEFKSAGRWFRRWIRELAEGHERAFVFMDSRFVVPHLVPIRSRRILLVYLMHNVHVTPPFRWDSPVTLPYRRVLSRIGGMNAMVTLTDRQREDIAARRGRRSNLFVVPNPVDEPAPPPQPVPRDPNLVVVVARLERQKRLGHAIAAFEQVVREIPGARLDIYGEGSRREALQVEIDRRGLRDHVTLRGFDPHAREALWSASAFLLTSSFEGYPLATVESMSRGCPVVAYDIKYGPREQITDGVDGFLVPPEDVGALAGRIVELLRSPELVERMSSRARVAARRFGPEEFLERWADVLRRAVELELRRTRIQDAGLETTRLQLRRGRLRFAGVLTVRGRSRRSKLEMASIELAAIEEETGAAGELPLKVECEGDVFRIRTPARMLGGPKVPEGARLRLRLVWENSAWETDLTPAPERPPSAAPSRSHASDRAPA
jgi:poly(glycerol-phosphate) alpha-glucosyltransferase